MSKDYSHIKVLIVEDEESLRVSYSTYLREEGFTVQEASDGQEALEKIKNFDYDIMLLDIMLPKIDGLEVLKRIKSDPHLKNKPVLLLTNLSRDSVIKESFDLGAEGYLIKNAENPETIKENILKALGME